MTVIGLFTELTHEMSNWLWQFNQDPFDMACWQGNEGKGMGTPECPNLSLALIPLPILL